MTKKAEIIRECKRLSESCLYTSTSLFIWLRFRRFIKNVFIILPLALGSLAGWKVLTEANVESFRVVASISAFLAGLLPSVYAALKFDDQMEMAIHSAAEFKSLQDRFRQAALVSSRDPIEVFEAVFRDLMKRVEDARGASLTPPEWCFRWAQRKVKAGDYDFDVDENSDESGG